jgi:hypothetical protein
MNIEREIVLPFVTQRLPKELWTHQAHLQVGIWHLLTYGLEESIALLRARIILYNHSVGGINNGQSGYHETLTQFYLRFLNKQIDNLGSSCASFQEFCEKIGEGPMNNVSFIQQYYSEEQLNSVAYRATYFPPSNSPYHV